MGQPKDRFAEYTPGPCWLGKPNGGSRYTMVDDGKVRIPGHRLAYEIFYEPIPPDMVAHHKCNTPLCYNPRHIEPLTQSENVKRGPLGEFSDACKHGHPWTPESTMIKSDGKRRCRICDNARRRKPRNMQTKPKRLDNVCANGHLIEGKNAYYHNGYTYCRQCRADAYHKRNAAFSAGERKTKQLKTHCKRGHLLKGKNVRVTKDGYRTCIPCETMNRRNRTNVKKPRF